MLYDNMRVRNFLGFIAYRNLSFSTTILTPSPANFSFTVDIILKEEIYNEIGDSPQRRDPCIFTQNFSILYVKFQIIVTEKLWAINFELIFA